MLVAVLAILTFSSAAKPDQTPVNLEPSIVRMVNQTVQPGVEVCVPIELVAQGNEAAVGFSMQFDPTILIYKEIKLGSAFPLGEVVPNIDSAAEGLIGIAVMLNQSLGIPAGTYTVVEVLWPMLSLRSRRSCISGIGRISCRWRTIWPRSVKRCGKTVK